MAKSTACDYEHLQSTRINDQLYSFLKDSRLDPLYWGNVFTEKHVTVPEQLSFLDEDDWLSFKEKSRTSWEKKIIDTVCTNFKQHLPSEEIKTIINNYDLEEMYWGKVFRSIGVTTHHHLKNLHADSWNSLISKSRQSYPNEKPALQELQRQTQKMPLVYATDEVYKTWDKEFKEVKPKQNTAEVDYLGANIRKMREGSTNKDMELSFDSCRTFINDREMKMSKSTTNTVPKCPVEMNADILCKASSGLITRGFYTTTDGVEKSRKQAIKICEPLKLMQPELKEKEDEKEFFIKTEYDRFQNQIDEGTIDVSLFVGVGKGSYSRKANTKKFAGTKSGQTFYSKMKYTIMSVNAIELDETSICLTAGVVDKLKKVENFIQMFGNNSTLARDTMLSFFETYGTHVHLGLVTLGGVYMFSATCDQSSSKSLVDLQKDTNDALGAIFPVNAKSFDIGVIANSSNKSVTSKEHTINKTNIQTKIVKVGGPSSSNFLEWKSIIANNLHDLAVIHMEKSGIWNIVEWRDYEWQNATTLSRYIYDSFKKLETKIGPLNETFKFNLKKTCDLVLSLQGWLKGCQNVQLPKLFEILDQFLIQNDNIYYEELIHSSIIIEFIKRVIDNKYTLSYKETILIKFRTQALVTAVQSTSEFEINDKILNFQNDPVWKCRFDNFGTYLDYIKTHILSTFEDVSIKERFQDQLERELCRFCEICEVPFESAGEHIFYSRLCLLAQARHRDRMQNSFKCYSVLTEFSFIINSFSDGVCNAVFSHSLFKSEDEFKTFIFDICIPMWEDMEANDNAQLENWTEELNKLFLSNIRSLSEKSISSTPDNNETSFRKGIKACCDEPISCVVFQQKCTKINSKTLLSDTCCQKPSYTFCPKSLVVNVMLVYPFYYYWRIRNIFKKM